MSEIINIENSKYEFEVLLVVRTRSDSNPSGYECKAAPITKSSIKYMEITDDLVNFGYTGTITFTNYFGILQKLGMYNITDEAPFVHVRFKNLDFSATKKIAPSIYFIGSLGRNYETSANVIDKHASFEFEEYMVAKLKRTTVRSVLEDASAVVGRGEYGDFGALGDSRRTPAAHAGYLIGQGLSRSNINVSVSLGGTPTDDKISLQEVGVTENHTTIFDAVQQLSNLLSFTLPADVPPEFNNYVSPGIIKVQNSPDYKDRQIVVKSLVEEINGFFKLIKTNKTSENISNYLTEKFSIALSNDSKTFGDNFISKYNLMRVNFQDVYEKKWGNLETICGTNDCTLNNPIAYETLRVAFERLFTAPYATNIPKREDEVDNDGVKTLSYSLKNIPERLAIGLGTNMMFKSFIFDNIALTFRVKGQPYRSAGKFIQIEADGSSSSKSTRSTGSTDELNGYWYIISVKHVFENDIYFNDYICVKIYNNNIGELSEIPVSAAGTGSSTETPTLGFGGQGSGGQGSGVYTPREEPELPSNPGGVSNILFGGDIPPEEETRSDSTPLLVTGNKFNINPSKENQDLLYRMTKPPAKLNSNNT